MSGRSSDKISMSKTISAYNSAGDVVMDRYLKKRITWRTRMGIRLVILFLLLWIPFIVVLTVIRPEQEGGTGGQYVKESAEPVYYVLCEQEAGSISVPLETALISMLAGVMKEDSPKEALRAMAILLRTQAVYEIEQTGSCLVQGYAGEAGLRERWGEQYDTYYAVYADAAAQTCGIIMTVDGKPIETAYHPVSAGRTRDPALLGGGHAYHWKSVKCEQDLMAQEYRTIVDCPAEKLDACLKALTGSTSISGAQIVIEERDEAGYVLSLSVSGEGFEAFRIGGERFRSVFGLPSSHFTMEGEGDGVRFICFGSGHGYGLSIYQSCVLAGEGRTCMDILKYFFDEIVFMRIA